MAQAPPSPWSRWDAPGYQYVSNQTEAPYAIHHDTGFEDPSSQTSSAVLPRLGASRLIEQRRFPDDEDFVECVYGVEKSVVRYIERCLAKDGCCETTCCKNRWEEGYNWAVALLIIFCVLVILALFITLFCWLYNRAKDKHQKRLINESMGGLSPAISKANMAAVENRNESGYYPFVGGPYQY
ncbi:unnamed protein product [Thelazia callipaeda]|uniref:CX domain-containing protein n=1 Tax=Thelazia callipaeda TaxID=103827 RepID=A0A0N5DAC7_THECL|nr:unnamed protein product [Thelazia callipaeda]